jgi:hypothetical protein
MVPRACTAALLAALAAPAAAQTIDGVPVTPFARTRAQPRPAAALAALREPSRADTDTPLSRLTVIELPPESSLPGARRHHALSIPLEGARHAVRSFGVDATACALQLRMPSRLAREMAAGARTTFEVQAQVRLACRM